MAKGVCTITSATMEFQSEKRDHVGETTAVAYCEAVAELPEDEIKDGEGGQSRENYGSYTIIQNIYSRTLTTYSELVYKWTASSPGDIDKEGQNVNLQFANLTRGEKNSNLYATVKVTCTKKVQNQIRYGEWWSIDVETGEEIDSGRGSDDWEDSGDAIETTNEGEASQQTNKDNVWTRPGSFLQYGGGWEMSVRHTIQADGGLTSDWTQKWADHMDKIAHWYYQSETNVAQGCVQQSGAVIYATWYNGCVELIEQYTDESCDTVTGGPKGTVITAAVINSLAQANKKEGEVSAS